MQRNWSTRGERGVSNDNEDNKMLEGSYRCQTAQHTCTTPLQYFVNWMMGHQWKNPPSLWTGRQLCCIPGRTITENGNICAKRHASTITKSPRNNLLPSPTLSSCRVILSSAPLLLFRLLCELRFQQAHSRLKQNLTAVNRWNMQGIDSRELSSISTGEYSESTDRSTWPACGVRRRVTRHAHVDGGRCTNVAPNTVQITIPSL